MESKVTVLTPNGRRQNVKVSPNTTILQILEEVCRKHSFESDSHVLKHHNREVGLTQLFRFSGLPNNCLLEMVESEKRRVSEKVDICIQLDDGTRQLSKFESSENIWNVVQKLCGNVVDTFENPVVLYMRQEISGIEELRKSTLKSLGIFAGRALLRLVDKKPEELKMQANVYKAPKEKEKNNEEGDRCSTSSESAPKKSTIGGAGFSVTKNLLKSLKANTDIIVANATEESSPRNTKDSDGGGNDDKDKDEKPKYDWGTGKGHSMQQKQNDSELQQENNENEMETEPEIVIIGDRKAILFSLENIQREAEEVSDSFYDLTINDLKLVLRGLRKISTGNEDVPLMTQKQREFERQKMMIKKLSQYRNCIIRVHFPDSYVLQGVFKASDTVSTIVEFVRKFLINENDTFILFTIPPKTILPLDKNLLELDLVPTAVVHFAWETESTNSDILKPEYKNQLTSIEGAIYAANKFRITNRSRSISPEVDDDDDDFSGPSTSAFTKRPKSDI